MFLQLIKEWMLSGYVKDTPELFTEVAVLDQSSSSLWLRLCLDSRTHPEVHGRLPHQAAAESAGPHRPDL